MKESRRITPLRTILRNCLNHIENLETNRSICDNYDKEFQDLKQFSEALKVQKEFSCTEGEREVNRKKNRYKDILPFNISRVVLSEYAGIPGSNYINANFIKGASGSPAYIASQGPLPNTVNDFWRMVVECEVQVIVMACNAQESGKHKCENYWVEKEGEEKRFGMVQICLVKASIVCPDFLVRTMRLKYTNDKDVTEERTVCQFHYSAWPDHGVPPLVRPLLDMVRLVRDTQASETLPVLVHCSAGCGRTGTICAIDFVWGLLRAGKLTEEFSLFNLVRDMRKQRVAMVQTKEQYILVHQAVRELFKEQLRVIESHPYENIDFNGVPLIKDFEEPFYDTICIQKEENCDEKQDNSEMKEKEEAVADAKANKSDAAPPLPRKKRPNVLFSKQEKEAENLTEKNRASFGDKEKEKSDASLSSILGKPRIVKLRALFEKSPTSKERSALKDRGSQTVSRSHSLGAIRKPLTAEVFPDASEDRTKPSASSQSSPSDAVVKLKHSKSFSKSVPLIKRSKSLKTFGQSPHLTVTPAQVVVPDRKSHGKILPSKPTETEARLTNGGDDRYFWKKAAPPTDPIRSSGGLSTDTAKRRRSLESLMGDAPPTITWPTAVMSADNGGQQQTPKFNAHTIQGSKTAELIRQQLQRLNIETEKRMNSFVSGLGTRERRNSFRQAVSKTDIQKVLRNFGDNPSGGAKLFQSSGPEGVKTSGNVSEPSNGSGGKFIDREDAKLSAAKPKIAYDAKKYKQSEPSIGPGDSSFPAKGTNVKHSVVRDNSTGHMPKATANHNSVGPRVQRTAMTVAKSNRTTDEVDRGGSASRNLFLKKLNSEIMSEREREYENGLLKTGEPVYTHMLMLDDVRKSPLKVKPSVYVNADGYDEPDGTKSRHARSMEVEVGDKVTQQWLNANYPNQQIYVKPQKSSKPMEDYKLYAAPPVANSTYYTRPEPSRMYQNAPGETSGGLRRDEFSPEIRRKNSFSTYPHRKNVCYVLPTKMSIDGETGSYRRSTPNVEYEAPLSGAKAMMVDKGPKPFDCLPWSHSASSRSSGEASSSDQHSTKSDSSRPVQSPTDGPSGPVKPDKMHKKLDRMVKSRSVDPCRLSQNSELPNGRRPAEELANSAVEFCNYGLVATSKLRQNPCKYSKDDFVLSEEPTAPPRVKRHASVTIPRSSMNSADHWTSSDAKAEKNPWNGTFGVDLDAVAASMQQGGAHKKGDSSGFKANIWTGKNHATSPGGSSTKKKQHYF